MCASPEAKLKGELVFVRSVLLQHAPFSHSKRWRKCVSFANS